MVVSADNIRYSPKQIDAAIAALSNPERLEYAQQAIEHAAPGLATIFTQALDAGGWFDPEHHEKLQGLIALTDDPSQLAQARKELENLLHQEVNLAMFVGATIGFQLARELQQQTEEKLGES